MHNSETTNILRKNAVDTQKATDALEELRYGILYDLSKLLATDPDASPASLYADVISRDLCTKDFAQFCRQCTRNAFDSNTLADLLPEMARANAESGPFTVAYLKNTYSDNAFSVFAGQLNNAEAHPGTSFQSVCEEVYYGRCGACILPFYTSEDGTLISFLRMIAKHDLKIAMTCDVNVQNEDNILRFALLQHTLSLPQSQTVHIQINAILPGELSIGTFLATCEHTGASVTDLVTLPLTYTSDFPSYTIRYRTDRSDLPSLLLFLHSVLDSYALEGIFTMLDFN